MNNMTPFALLGELEKSGSQMEKQAFLRALGQGGRSIFKSLGGAARGIGREGAAFAKATPHEVERRLSDVLKGSQKIHPPRRLGNPLDLSPHEVERQLFDVLKGSQKLHPPRRLGNPLDMGPLEVSDVLKGSQKIHPPRRLGNPFDLGPL